MNSTARAFGTVGYWRGRTLLTGEMAAAVENLGFQAIWVGVSPPADLAIIDEVLDATTRVPVATGIVNIWTADARAVAESYHRIEAAHPGRFWLGIGIGHRERNGDLYVKPYQALVAYLDVLDAEGVPADRRIISALGPRTLQLAAERSAGTHPYMSTPAHTRFAREVVGPDVFVAPEQRLVVDPDPDSARAAGRKFLARYLGLRNYRSMLEAHGFTPAELDNGATDAAVDALAPHGTAADLAGVVRGHLDAGADHVCVQTLPATDDPLPALAQLARALHLS